ncbi:SAM-dependent methyltransferase [Streptomyces montanisoli]|uniref:SAM-dependent methyltransferase n=1 Tax=Streptomyces montanisoli TaxID=2798581 RepID=A0A940MGV2_9ACTN|nr:SAM-dependent methyltransferase [Streptomyces montanisoli]MBP0459800.1 SAM-dependent methyltransferase [Streptomyces montanisoli]
MTDLDQVSLDEIDTSKPHPARMYDFYLQGKDYYEADEIAGQKVLEVFPTIKITARVNRSFMHRFTRHLATDKGIRQFLDIGTGIPTRPNLHQVAQEAAPEARVVYADYDPVVLRHAEALMRSTPEGRTTYIQADVREPESIMAAAELHETIDLKQPVALSLNALLHFVPDENKPYEIVRYLLDQLAPGSYLAISHCTADFAPEMWAGVAEVYHRGGIPLQLRSRDEVAAFFDGLDLVEPGVVTPHNWHPDGVTVPGTSDDSVSMYAAVARKP